MIKFNNSALVLDNLAWFSKRKKWCGLSDVQGQGALSSYKYERKLSLSIHIILIIVSTNPLL